MKLRCRDGSRPITMSSGSATCPGANAIAPIFGEEMRQTVAALTPSVVNLHFGLPERSTGRGNACGRASQQAQQRCQGGFGEALIRAIPDYNK